MLLVGVAFGITVPKALGDFLVLEALYATGGTAVAEGCVDGAGRLGIDAGPEGGARLIALPGSGTKPGGIGGGWSVNI